MSRLFSSVLLPTLADTQSHIAMQPSQLRKLENLPFAVKRLIQLLKQKTSRPLSDAMPNIIQKKR